MRYILPSRGLTPLDLIASFAWRTACPCSGQEKPESLTGGYQYYIMG